MRIDSLCSISQHLFLSLTNLILIIDGSQIGTGLVMCYSSQKILHQKYSERRQGYDFFYKIVSSSVPASSSFSSILPMVYKNL